jgi:hypothetical protein
MKKILKSSIVLFMFSFAMLLFQMSCKKDATAQTTTTGLTQLNKIIYLRTLSVSAAEIWTANYDGTSQTKVNINIASLPTAIGNHISNPVLSPTGQTVFFVGLDTTTYLNHIYSCNINGSNVQKIVDGSNTPQGITIGGAY